MFQKDFVSRSDFWCVSVGYGLLTEEILSRTVNENLIYRKKV